MTRYIDTMECTFIPTRGTSADLIAVTYDDDGEVPSITIDQIHFKQQLVKANGIPVAIIANGNELDENDVLLLQKSVAERLIR